MSEENRERVERSGRIFWDWSKGPPPNRPGEETIEVKLGYSRYGNRIVKKFHQARRATCPFCGLAVVLAATGSDPNLRQRHYFEPNGRKHYPKCTNREEAMKGVLLERRESL